MTLHPLTRLLTLLLPRRFVGITLPPFGIYLRPEHMSNQRLIKHEQAHWRQYERMGLVGFYASYLWLSLRHGYRQNPMEVEAQAAELA